MTDNTELRRLRMRSWRRGTKEMDLILGPYADKALEALDRTALDDYAALLEENDQSLFAWITGQETAPVEHGPALERVRVFHAI